MDPLITLTIDNRQIAVPAGTTVLEAARSAGIEIPTFCHHDKLVPIGGCRMCLVEIEKVRGLQTACTTPVRQDMVVHTDTPQVIKARQANLEFLLTNHPLDCPVCDKGGECELQDQVYKFGPGVSRFIEEKRHKRKALPLSKTILMDQERCVLCRRCIRFLEEWSGDIELGLFERGAHTYVDTFPGQELRSPFAGNLIEICPVGALTSRPFRFKARSWELERTPGLCPLCSVGCNVYLDTRNRRLLRIMARSNPEVNDQWLCDRGRFEWGFIYTNRITEPLIRRNNELRPASWDEALEVVSERLGSMAEREPPAAGALGSAKATNEANYLLQKLMRAVVGSNSVDYLHRMPENAQPVASAADLRQTDAVFLIAVDLEGLAPVAELFLRHLALMYKTRLIVASVNPVSLSRFGMWLPYRPGTEAKLLGGLAQALITTGKAKNKKQEGVSWAGYELSTAAEETGIPVRELQQAARILSEARYSLVIYGPGLVCGPQGEDCLHALENMTSLAGAVGPSYLAPEANTVGALDMGLAPHLYPGLQPVGDERNRDRLARLWGVKRLLETPGRPVGELKVLYVMGCDPIAEWHVRPAGLEFLVVQDVNMTATARVADVVLPAASFAEIDGTFTNLKGRVQRLRPAIPLYGQSRPDWQILCDVARRLIERQGGSKRREASWEYTSPSQIMDEIAQAAPSYDGLNYATIGEQGQPRVEKRRA